MCDIPFQTDNITQAKMIFNWLNNRLNGIKQEGAFILIPQEIYNETSRDIASFQDGWRSKAGLKGKRHHQRKLNKMIGKYIVTRRERK